MMWLDIGCSIRVAQLRNVRCVTARTAFGGFRITIYRITIYQPRSTEWRGWAEAAEGGQKQEAGREWGVTGAGTMAARSRSRDYACPGRRAVS